MKNKVEILKQQDQSNKLEILSTSSYNKLKPFSPSLLNKKPLLADPLIDIDDKMSIQSKIPEILTPKRNQM